MTLRSNAEQDFDTEKMELVQKPLEKDQVEMISKSIIEQIHGVQKGKSIFKKGPPTAKKSAFDLNRAGIVSPLKVDQTQNKAASFKRSTTNVKGAKLLRNVLSGGINDGSFKTDSK